MAGKGSMDLTSYMHLPLIIRWLEADAIINLESA